jgi:hypothetical protein
MLPCSLKLRPLDSRLASPFRVSFLSDEVIE